MVQISLKHTIFVALTLLNCFLWYFLGRQRSISRCEPLKSALPCQPRLHRQSENKQTSCPRKPSRLLSKFYLILSSKFAQYKQDRLVGVRHPDWSLLVTNSNHTTDCNTIVNPIVSFKRKFSCFVMVRAENMEQSSNLIRYEEVEDVVSSSSNIEGEQSKPTTDNKSRGKKKTKPNKREKEEEEGEEEETTEEEEEGVEEVEDEVKERRRLSRLKTKTKAVRITMGFFDHVANDNSRQLLRLKLQPLLQHLSLLRHMVQRELSGRGLVTGSTVLVMTVNTGEVDLLANFLCSLVSHHLAADVMQRIVVFTPSADVVPILHSLGVIGIHHSESFAYASDAANGEYLDRTFIDMMWYKSFSVWLLLSLGYHVLFQDVDIVWFRDPFRYFQQLSHRYFQRTLTTGRVREPDAILSDDGQRSIRYTPFYANSGFYFFRSNERMEAVAWSIVTAFDLLHISGSHQNIFTLRLLEGMDLSPAPGILTLFLPMNDFPSGVKYSHDRPYMRNIANDVEHPYIFHM